MDSLPPIPTPSSQRRRELRIQLLPPVTFLCVVAAIFYIWKNYVQPVNLVGQVESIRSTVISIQDGTLAELTVNRLDRVAKDQPIGRVITVDPQLAEAALNVIAADLKLMQARMGLDKIRNLDSYTRLRIELLNENIALGIAQARMKQADSEWQRLTKLYEAKLIPAGVAQGAGQNNIFGVEVAQRDRDALRTDIEHRTRLIAQLEKDIRDMEAAGASAVAPRDPAIEEAIRTQQEKMALADKPVILKAPIDGTVSGLLKHPGEKIVRGEPIVTLAPLGADHIVGYLRQPLTSLPSTNDTVQVRTRSSRRQIASARIVKVGTELEMINPLLLSPDGTRKEMGLPFLVALPPSLTLTPGEFVDLTVVSAKK
jgi:multidrug resistance efflux pump